MTQTTPPSITPSPAAPDRADRNTFSSRATAWSDWLKTHGVPEIAAVATNVYDNAVDAYNNATSAASDAGTATTQAGYAYGSAQAAASSAASAASAPGTSATSTTSLTVAAGAQSLTIQAGKSLAVGMSVAIARTSDAAAIRMYGTVTSYDAGTGALAVNVTNVDGSGTYADWTVSLSAAVVGSDLGKRVLQVKVIDDATTLTTGDGKVQVCIPGELDGYKLTRAEAYVTTVSSSGTPTIQIRRVPSSDMLTTRITIDVSEKTSYTASAGSVVDASNAAVAAGDLIAVDVDIAGTNTKGLGVILTFNLT